MQAVLLGVLVPVLLFNCINVALSRDDQCASHTHCLCQPVLGVPLRLQRVCIVGRVTVVLASLTLAVQGAAARHERRKTGPAALAAGPKPFYKPTAYAGGPYRCPVCK